MHPAVVFLAGVTLVALAFVVARRFTRERRLARAIRDARVVRVAQAKDGAIVRIVGRLRPEGPALRAPFTGRPCAHYDAVVEERWLRDRGEVEWLPLGRETASRSFALEDDTGRALVETSRFEVLVVLDREVREEELEPELARAFLARYGEDRASGRVLRFREGVLEGGEKVTVLGRARWESGEGGAKRLVIRAIEGGTVRASDDPGVVMAGARVSMFPPDR